MVAGMRRWGTSSGAGALRAGVIVHTLILLAAFATTVSTSAQEVTASHVRASSSNPELPHPDGFGLGGEVAVHDWLLGLELVRYADETVRPGRVCRSPGVACDVEDVTASASLTGLRAVASRAVHIGPAVRVSAGAGASFGAVSVTATGTSGRRAFVYVPNEGQLGWMGVVAVELAPLPDLPLRLLGRYAVHWMAFRGCVDPTEPTSGDAFFCGNDRFGEVAVGLAWDLTGVTGG